MNTLEAISNRKSIRSYTGEKISDDSLDAILKAGCEAPVGMRQYDTLHITVVSDADELERIESAADEFMGRPNMKCLHGAPTYVIVSSKPNTTMSSIAYSNATTVIENMLLAAVDIGVGACCVWGPIVAAQGDSSILDDLGIPEGFVPCAGIVLGKTTECYEPREDRSGQIAVNKIG